jgi:hypothetical protein
VSPEAIFGLLGFGLIRFFRILAFVIRFSLRLGFGSVAPNRT